MASQPHPRLPPMGARLWVFAFCAWTLLALLSFAQGATFMVVRGMPLDWTHRFPQALADWWTCGMFTPAFYWMVRHVPIRGRRWWSSVLLHLAASLAFAVIKSAIYAPIFDWIYPAAPRGFAMTMVSGTFADLLGYWGAVGALHAIEYYRESQARSLEAARLDVALRSAELENLRAQLQPHFLFNTLQAISTLIHREPAGADRMLTDLSELLRVSLKHAAAQEVPLREELDFLSRYLDIMRTRFGDRLSIDVEVAPDLLEAMVPSLVLQPLVENSIRHGMADRTDQGSVRIRSRVDGKSLVLEVADDGPGLSHAGATEGNGIGLANTRERLARLYGPEHSIEVDGKRGMQVRLTIPLRYRGGMTA